MPLLPIGSVCGASVRGSDGETLGSITEVMVDSESGAIAYVALSYGGVLGVGEKLFAVDWRRLTSDPDSGELHADLPRDRLDELPGFDPDAWPTEPDRALDPGSRSG